MRVPGVRRKLTPAELRARRTGVPLAERDVEEALLALGVEHVHQHPIPGTRYVADFFLPAGRVVLEVDGRVHLGRRMRAHDERRDARLRELGYRIARITNAETMAPGLVDRLPDVIRRAW